MKLSDDEQPPQEVVQVKHSKKKKRLEDMDEDSINAELKKFGMNPDDLKLDDDELP